MIAEFSGDYSFLSNFWRAEVEFEGELYPTVEHAFQAAKTTNTEMRDLISALASPGEAKRVGRSLVLREDWEDVKRDVMLACLRSKFRPGTALAEKLIATGDEVIVEGNHWGDKVWGATWDTKRTEATIDWDFTSLVGSVADLDALFVWDRREQIEGARRVTAGLVGQNWLGRLLMLVREELWKLAQRLDDEKIAAEVAARDAADTGERTTLEDVAAESGIDLDDLRAAAE